MYSALREIGASAPSLINTLGLLSSRIDSSILVQTNATGLHQTELADVSVVASFLACQSLHHNPMVCNLNPGPVKTHVEHELRFHDSGRVSVCRESNQPLTRMLGAQPFTRGSSTIRGLSSFRVVLSVSLTSPGKTTTDLIDFLPCRPSDDPETFGK